MTTLAGESAGAGTGATIAAFVRDLVIVWVMAFAIWAAGWAVEEYLIADVGFFVWMGTLIVVLLVLAGISSYRETR